MQDKRTFNILHGPLLSFYSGDFYRDVIYHWKGVGLAYLLLLTLLFAVPETLKFQREINQFLTEAAPKIVSQFPVLTIKNGTLSMNSPSPHRIFYGDDNKPFIIIDTNNSYGSPVKANVFVYLTDKKAFFKRAEEDYAEVEFSRFDDIVITHDRLYKWIEFLKATFAFFFFPVLYLFSLLYFMLHVVVCSSIGMLMARKIHGDMTYAQLFRLSAVALTPPIMLQIAHTLLEVEFAYSGPITFLFALGYVYYGLKSAADKK
jgi:hypothetical protein